MRWGSLGAFVEQRIVTGGKLRLDQQVAMKSVEMAELEKQAAEWALRARVRDAYYELLGAQERAAVLEKSANTVRATAQTLNELRNIGMADLPDTKMAMVDVQRAELLLAQAQTDVTQAEIALRAWTGASTPTTAEGDYRQIRELQQAAVWAKITENHPWLLLGRTGTERAEIALHAARAARIPDVRARGGLRYNRELSDVARGARGPGSVGTEGIFDVGVEIPLFDRKQGLIAAAKAERAQWQAEPERQQQALQIAMSNAWRDYVQAKAGALQYRTNMIPAAEESLALYLKNFRSMSSPYPNVLNAQRSLLQLREEEIAQLHRLWKATVRLETMLIGEAME